MLIAKFIINKAHNFSVHATSTFNHAPPSTSCHASFSFDLHNPQNIAEIPKKIYEASVQFQKQI